MSRVLKPPYPPPLQLPTYVSDQSCCPLPNLNNRSMSDASYSDDERAGSRLEDLLEGSDSDDDVAPPAPAPQEEDDDGASPLSPTSCVRLSYTLKLYLHQLLWNQTDTLIPTASSTASRADRSPERCGAR